MYKTSSCCYNYVVVITCAEPDNRTGVVLVLPNLLQYLGILKSSCAEGYLYQEGDYRRVCGLGGQWSGTPLVCHG